MTEVSHIGLVKLVRVGVRYVLLNKGTNERCVMDEPGDVQFDVNGRAYYSPASPHAPCKWANDCFLWSLHERVHEVGDLAEPERFIYNKETEAKFPIKDLQCSFVPKVVSMQRLKSEVFVYRLSPHADPYACLAWGIPYVQQFLGHSADLRWAFRNFAAWECLLDDIGLGASRAFRSRTSVVSKAKATGQTIDVEYLHASPPEFSLTSAAVIAVACQLARRSTKHDSEESRKLAELLVQAMVAKAADGEQFEIGDKHDGSSFNVRVSECRVVGASLTCQSRYGFMKKALPAEGSDISLSDFVVKLFVFATASRLSKSTATLAKRVFVIVCTVIEGLFEHKASTGELFNEGVSHMSLDMIRPGKRAKRIPAAFKVEMVEQTARTQGVSRPSTLAACEKMILVKKGLNLDGWTNGKTAQAFVVSSMLQYWASVRQATSGDKHASICFDGLRAGGEELLLIAYFSTRSQLASWLPIQVIILEFV